MSAITIASLVGAVLLSPGHPHSAAPKPAPAPSIVTAGALRRACLALLKVDTTRTPHLRRICRAHYSSNPRVFLTDSTVKSEIDSIAVIEALLPDSLWRRALGHVDEMETPLLPTEGLKSALATSLNESAVFWSLAQLIADRARAEANEYLVKRFVASACSGARMILPNTCALFANDGALADAIRNPLLIQIAARKDAFVAPLGLLRVQLANNADAVRKQPEASIAGEMILAAITASAQGATFDNAIASAVSRDMVSLGLVNLSVDSTPAAANLYLAGLTAASLGEPVTTIERDFETIALADLYTRKAVLLNLYLGRPWPSPTHHAAEIWRCPQDAANLYCSWTTVDSLLALAMSANASLANAAEAAHKSPGNDRAAALARYTSALLAAVNEFAAVSGPVSPRFLAVGNGVHVIADSLAAQHIMGVVGALLALPDSLGMSLAIPPVGLRAITLVASLADAQKTSDAVVVLEGFTQNSRTFLDKRNPVNGTYVEINAYGGAGMGWEHLLQTSGTSGADAPYGAIYAPVGVEIGRPVHWAWGAVESASVFLQAIDLGALTSWRLKSSSDINQDPEVHLTQVFAPGVNVLFGIKGVPLSIGTGFSLSPRIRDVNANGVRTAKNAFRVPLVVGMDVPLFP